MKKPADWIRTRQENKRQNLKNVHLEKKGLKVKKDLFFHFMAICNFALKIETSLPKRVIKPISETRKTYKILVHLSLIFSFLNEKI